MRKSFHCSASSRSEVGNARQTCDPDIALACNDGLWNRAHADCVSSQPSKGPDFGRGFIAWSAHGKIDAGPKFHSAVLCCLVQQQLKLWIVSMGHIDKPRLSFF